MDLFQVSDLSPLASSLKFPLSSFEALAYFDAAMTNPAQAIRMLITYAVCIPLAILMGYIMTEVGNRPDYSNLFVIGLVVAVLASPIFIKWYYPIMVFGLGCPMYCFFLKGNPPLLQVVVIIGFTLAIIERAVNSERRFIKASAMTWPLLFTLAMAITTAELTGGIGLKTLGGDVGGGKKYLTLFIGIAMFFALTSRRIPKEKRTLYVAFLFLSGAPAFISDLFPVLPAPLNYINLLFPPSSIHNDGTEFSLGTTRLGAFSTTASCVANYLLARYGLRGIIDGQHPRRLVMFGAAMLLTTLGGFRLTVISFAEVIIFLFFMEGLHRTRLLLACVLGGTLFFAVMIPFANKMPYTLQRSISFLPLNFDSAAVNDADGSKKWREQIWADTWPKVPQYLLLGKGYALHAEDFALMGGGAFEGVGSGFDHSLEGLAISMDYHNGPLSTLMPFGVWGMISYLWVALATIFVLFRNYRYGEQEIKPVNLYLFAMSLNHFIGYFFLFGSYADDIGEFAKLTGFSIALNWGIKSAPSLQAATSQMIRRLPMRPNHPRIQPV